MASNKGSNVVFGKVTSLYPPTRAAEREHWGLQPDLAKKCSTHKTEVFGLGQMFKRKVHGSGEELEGGGGEGSDLDLVNACRRECSFNQETCPFKLPIQCKRVQLLVRCAKLLLEWSCARTLLWTGLEKEGGEAIGGWHGGRGQGRKRAQGAWPTAHREGMVTVYEQKPVGPFQCDHEGVKRREAIEEAASHQSCEVEERKGKEGVGYIAVPAYEGSLAEAYSGKGDCPKPGSSWG
eukprot:1138842-Pelagomonas_calceolata.AAC.4